MDDSDDQDDDLAETRGEQRDRMEAYDLLIEGFPTSEEGIDREGKDFWRRKD